MDLKSMTVREQVRAIYRAETAPSEICQQHVREIHAENPKLKALCFVNADQAQKQAQKLEEIPLNATGRLHGTCFSVKDHINVTGLPSSLGSKQSFRERDTHSASAVRKLEQAGAICIGKSNMAENGKSYFTENPLYGRTHSPFHKEHSPGGSGGGDAAAVAANFASFGLGADAGGSLRIPANFCGLFGLFATPGIISTHGLHIPNHTILNLFRSLGPIAKSLDDIELLFSVLAAYDPRDPHALPRPPQARFNRKQHKKKFAWFRELNGVACDSSIEEALGLAVDHFNALGWHAENIEEACFANCYEPFILLAGQALLEIDDALLRARGFMVNPEQEGSAMQNLRKRIATELPPLTSETLLRCWYHVSELRLEAATLFEKYDFILCPVSATPPPRYGTTSYEIGNQVLESQEVFQFASVANVLGLPALAFPTNLADDGLPRGLQVMGPRFSEYTLIDILREAGYREAISCSM